MEGKTLLLLKPRGFCAGVVRAIDIVRIALETFGPPIYVRKEIVHNRYVVDELTAKGAIFVDSVEEVPAAHASIYALTALRRRSAGQQARELQRDRRHLPAGDQGPRGSGEVCPGRLSLILIGHRDHDEVIGTLGEAPTVTQVVELCRRWQPSAGARSGSRRLSHADHAQSRRNHTRDRGVAEEVPQHQGPARARHLLRDENRQTAVKDVAKHADLLLVVGSENSSNSNRLVEVATEPRHQVLPHRERSFHQAGVACGREDRGDLPPEHRRLRSWCSKR